MTLDIAEKVVHERLANSSLRRPSLPLEPLVIDAVNAVEMSTSKSSALRDALKRRASSRDLSAPVTSADLSELLTPLLVPSGVEGEWRWGFATTGGLSAFQILVSVDRGDDLPTGTYWFIPKRSRLAPTTGASQARARLSALAQHSLGNPHTAPAAIIAVIADWGRLAGIYEGATLASSYWEAGSIMAHLYLTGTEAGLSCCACSAIDDAALIAELGLDPNRFGHVGTFAVAGKNSA